MEEDKRNSTTFRAHPQLHGWYASLAAACGWKSIRSIKQATKLCSLLLSDQLFQEYAHSRYVKRKSDSLSQKLHGCTSRTKTYRSNKHGFLLWISRFVLDVGLSISTNTATERVSNLEWLLAGTWLHWRIWGSFNISPWTRLVNFQRRRIAWLLQGLLSLHICYHFLGSSFTCCDWHSSQHLPLFAKLTKQKISRTTNTRAITASIKLDGCAGKGRTRFWRWWIWWRRWWRWVW